MSDSAWASTAVGATLSLLECAGRQWDVLVAGAGPAGALSARSLAQRGLSVLLVDRAGFPRPKVCGCCLNGVALGALAEAGLGRLPEQCGAIGLREIHLCRSHRQAVIGLPGGAVLSRAALDGALVQAAIAAGAQFLPRTTATLARIGPDRCEADLRHAPMNHGGAHRQGGVSPVAEVRRECRISALVAVAADGLSGRFLKEMPDPAPRGARRGKLGAAALVAEPPGYYAEGAIYMAHGREGYVGLVRLEDGDLDVAAALAQSAVRSAGGPGPVAERILDTAGLPVPRDLAQAAWRGTPPLNRRRSRVAGRRLFILGDAAGYVEPFTGEGMGWAMSAALLSAPLVSRAADRWSDALAGRWQETYQRSIGRRQRTCRMVAAVLNRPWLAELALGWLRHFPRTVRPLLAAINVPLVSGCERRVS